VIFAKGQGNFETLSDEPFNIFFLFKAKCSVIAEHAGVPIGTHVLASSNGRIVGLGGAS
jgi:damage-control phosphatase, subfamily I